MTLTPDSRDAILRAIPSLRAFAISLTGNVDAADDLVQEAILRGLSNMDKFTPGTSMQAWLFTILRNHFHTMYRRKRREVEDPNGFLAERRATPPAQQGYIDLEDLKLALAKLSLEQREALILVAAQGFSYEEAAAICGANIGTIKSRINRARTRLAELTGIDDAEEIGADRLTRAAMQE